MKYPVKILFLEVDKDSTPNWELAEDWSSLLASAPDINPRIESENEGEAGLIVYDNASLSMYYRPNTSIYTLFNSDLTAVKKYLIKILLQKPQSLEYIERYEGIIDLSSVTFPQGKSQVHFNVVDKISALSIIQNNKARTEIGLLKKLGTNNIYKRELYGEIRQQLSTGVYTAHFLMLDGNLVPSTDVPAGILNVGEVIKTKDHVYLITESVRFLEFVPLLGRSVYRYNLILFTNSSVNPQIITTDEAVIYSKDIYGVDCYVYDGNKPGSINALNIIKSLIKNVWQDFTLINKTGQPTFNIPLNYFDKFLDENPLGTDPKSALQQLSDTMKSYVFFNRNGELVVQSKQYLGVNAVVRTINTKKISDGESKLFWDKVVDFVEIKMKSWLRDSEGNDIEVASQLAKVPGAKPRNPLSKELLCSNSTITSKTDLMSIADQEAQAYMSFYGLRHDFLSQTIDLDDETIEWDLLDNVMINNKLYFIINMPISTDDYECTLEMVSVSAYAYDVSQIVLPKNETAINNYNFAKLYTPPVSAQYYEGSAIEVDNLMAYIRSGNGFVKYQTDRQNIMHFGQGLITLAWSPMTNKESDPSDKFRVKYYSEYVLENGLKYIGTTQGVRINKEEFAQGTDYVIFAELVDEALYGQHLNPYPNYARMMKVEGKFVYETDWVLIDRFPAPKNLVYGKDLIERTVNITNFLGKFLRFWVGLVIPIQLKNGEKSITWDSQGNLISDGKTRCGSGHIGRIFIKGIGPGNFSYNENTKEYTGIGNRVSEINDEAGNKKQVIESCFDVLKANKIEASNFSRRTITGSKTVFVISESALIKIAQNKIGVALDDTLL